MAQLSKHLTTSTQAAQANRVSNRAANTILSPESFAFDDPWCLRRLHLGKPVGAGRRPGGADNTLQEGPGQGRSGRLPHETRRKEAPDQKKPGPDAAGTRVDSRSYVFLCWCRAYRGDPSTSPKSSEATSPQEEATEAPAVVKIRALWTRLGPNFRTTLAPDFPCVAAQRRRGPSTL